MARQQTDIISKLEDVNKSLPALPRNIKDIFVMIAPWFALIAGILGIVGVLSTFGAIGIFSGLGLNTGMYGGFTGIFYVYLVVGLITSVIDLMAFAPLRANKYKGWMYLLWSEGIGLVVNIVGFNVIGILFSLVYLYILFQIKSYYK